MSSPVAPVSLRALLRAGLFAATILWLADLAIMLRSSRILPHPLYPAGALAVLLLCGLILACVEWALLNIPLLCARRLNLSRARAGIVFSGAVVGCVSLLLVAPVSLTLLAGPRISRWWTGPRWIAPAVLGAMIGGVVAWGLACRQRWNAPGAQAFSFGRLGISVALCAAGGAILYCDLFVYPDLYQYLHMTAALGAFVVLQALHLTVEPVRGAVARRLRRVRPLPVGRLAILILLSQCAVFPLFLRGNSQRVFAWGKPYYHRKAAQAIRRVWDIDRDGFSPVLGGGDPDDLDPRRVPLGMGAGAGAGQFHHRTAVPRDPPLQKRIQELTEKTSRYNMLFISVDAMRADRLIDETTARKIIPCMAALRDRSVFFTRCFAAASFTPISIPRLMASRFDPWEGDAPHPSLAERLKDAGYSTVAILNPAMGGGKRIGYLHRGFEHLRLTERGRFDKHWTGGLMDGDISAAAVKEIDAHRNEKFFIWVHLMDLHEWPYLDRSVYGTSMAARDKYDYLLSRADAEVCRILGALKANGIDTTTTVVLFSDHGQGLGEHGVMTHTQYVYHSLIHVPLAVHIPGVEPVCVAQNVSLLDLAPTALELAGVPPPDDLEGISLVPAVAGGALPACRPIVSVDAKQRSVIVGPWKLIVTVAAGAVELFNLDEDPAERNDLSGELSLQRIKEAMLSELARYADLRVVGPDR